MNDEQLSNYYVPTEEQFCVLDHVAAGECSADDESVMLIEHDRSLRTVLHAMRNIDPRSREGPWDFARAWTAFEIRNLSFPARHVLRLHSPDGAVAVPVPVTLPSRKPTMPIMRRVKPWLTRQVGATITLCGFAALTWFALSKFDRGTKSPVSMREVTTQIGQRISVRLADGTLVTLAPDSKLRVPENYGERSRDMVLEGSAFFDIAHHNEQPFVVQIRHVRVRVLGTRFSIKAYNTDSVTVAVAEGKVGLAMDGAAAEAIVMAGHVGIMTPSGATHVNPAHIERYTGWVDDQLVFDDTPVAEVIEELGRWYGVQLAIGDSALLEQTITTNWTNSSLQHVLYVISKALNVRVERRGSEIVLYPRGPG